MPGSNFFALLDDIASLLDDVAAMSKVATKKTAGVLGDDLALNAQQVAGVQVDRELPVVWAVAKGSLLNKCILVPAALLISFFAPWAIAPLLILGGAFLCFEGVEKLHHSLWPSQQNAQHQQALQQALENPQQDLLAFEAEKIKGAIRTDFILSAEIIVIALGTLAAASFTLQALVVSCVALLMTFGVYGAVAIIIKLDDAGLYLCQRYPAQRARVRHGLGQMLLLAAPKLMKVLSWVGTAAMFLVGGGILVHNIPLLHHALQALQASAQTAPLASLWGLVVEPAFSAAMGVGLGAAVLLGVQGVLKVRSVIYS